MIKNKFIISVLVGSSIILCLSAKFKVNSETINHAACFPALTASQSQNEQAVDVTKFGVRPDDGSDATLAVREALEYCRKSKSRKLIFPKGKYYFSPDLAFEKYYSISNNDGSLKRIAFPIIDFNNFEIDGQGSEFVFSGFICPFIIDKSANISIKNFSIDYKRTFHSEATVIDARENEIDVSFSGKYPYTIEKGEFVEIDQLKILIEGLRKKPTGKKHIVDSWNPGDTPRMSLPPCHVLYQATANEEGEMELQLYQRSCDQFLGVPFNIASYAALTQVIAQEAGMAPKTFIHTFGDSHFYASIGKRTEWHKANFRELQKRIRNVSAREEYLEVVEWINKNAPADGNEEKYDHVTAILEQLSKEPRPMPKLRIAKKPFDQLTIDDFVVEEYDPHPPIRRNMCV